MNVCVIRILGVCRLENNLHLLTQAGHMWTAFGIEKEQQQCVKQKNLYIRRCLHYNKQLIA